MEAIRQVLADQRAALVVLAIGIAYAAGVVLVRWNMVAKPIRYQILSRIYMITTEANTLGAQHDKIKAAVLSLAEEARRVFKKYPLWDWLFWSRGQETANWQLIDQAECMLIETWQLSRVEARLLTAVEELKQARRPEVKVIAAKIEALHRDTHEGHTESQSGIHHALLQEAILAQRSHLHEEDIEIDYYSNKMMWYIGISLLAVVLVAMLGNELPILPGDKLGSLGCLSAGCVGGVLSRLMQTVSRPAHSVEYSSRWMVLFLSPLAGALAGWGGLLLLYAGARAGVLNSALEGKLEVVQVAMGLALLFGFSERLFTGFVESVTEGNLVKQKQQSQPAGVPQ